MFFLWNMEQICYFIWCFGVLLLLFCCLSLLKFYPPIWYHNARGLLRENSQKNKITKNMCIHYHFLCASFKSAIYSYFINRGLKERRSASLKIKIHEEKVVRWNAKQGKTDKISPKTFKRWKWNQRLIKILVIGSFRHH